MKTEQILKEIRKKNGYTQSQIAQLLGIKPQNYYRYESGKRELPMHLYIVLADFYGVSLDYLCGRDEQHNQQDGFSAG